MEDDMDWRPISEARKDGTKIWGWLYDSGIVLMRWMTAQENADEAGDPENPDEYIACWVKASEPSDGEWHPKFWLPFEAINTPPNVIWVSDADTGRWRDRDAR